MPSFSSSVDFDFGASGVDPFKEFVEDELLPLQDLMFHPGPRLPKPYNTWKGKAPRGLWFRDMPTFLNTWLQRQGHWREGWCLFFRYGGRRFIGVCRRHSKKGATGKVYASAVLKALEVYPHDDDKPSIPLTR